MIRATAIAIVLAGTALAMLPLQLVGLAFRHSLARWLPVMFHRLVCRLAGVRIAQTGERSRARGLLILANHVSWLDICVIGALAPTVFVAKKEVATWPVFGWLARLQRTVFIDRERRQRTGAATREIADRLLNGDSVVLFAEGTSGDGGRVLPFRSALIGAVHHAVGAATHLECVTVQPLALTYRRIGGVPVGRADRHRIAWYGDMDLIPHLAGVLKRGACDVSVIWGEALPYDMKADRKEVARRAEDSVRRMLVSSRA